MLIYSNFNWNFLAIFYLPHTSTAFLRVISISRDINYGWIIRIIHSNRASFFFLFIYIHISRGIYFGSYNFFRTWISGVVILFIIIATAFLGYVLPWGQISFWGATVITNLISAIPYIGNLLVQWIWGGFSVSSATLTRFFSFHFLLPFLITFIVIIHLIFLHQTGSSNPLGLKINIDKISFHPFFSYKDIVGFINFLFFLFILINSYPYLLNDPDNFTPANPLVTPVHIQPEWYFLFAYAILRSIPNKLGGVIALILSIAILLILPFTQINLIKSFQFLTFSKFFFEIISI